MIWLLRKWFTCPDPAKRHGQIPGQRGNGLSGNGNATIHQSDGDGSCADLSSRLSERCFVTNPNNRVFKVKQLKKIKFADHKLSSVMKGISFVTDGQNKKVAVQIELKVLERYDEQMEDLIDGIIAESRRDEQQVPLNKVIRNLKQAGKLK
jgi:hypothetical protein